MMFLPTLLMFALATAAPASNFLAPQSLQLHQTSRTKVIEQYEVDPADYEADPIKAKRILDYVQFFDGRGRLVESWDIMNEEGGSHYSRKVYTYDRFGRKESDLTYESVRTAPGEFFSISRTARSIKIVPEVMDHLNEIAIREYDRAGNLFRWQWTDGNGKLNRTETSEFDSKGNQLKSRTVKGDGTVQCESTSVYSENERLVETTLQHCETSRNRKVISRRDGAGRTLLEEQYFPTIKDGNKASWVLTNRAVSTYVGDIETLDWTLSNDKGEPQTRFLVTGKGDDTLSKKEFVPESSSSDSVGERTPLKWNLLSEEVYEYKYDNEGNQIRHTRRQRAAPDKPFHYSYVIEMIVTHF